jgi:hypothetical protein
MIQLVVSDLMSGGVFDFTNSVKNALDVPASLVHLTKDNICDWTVSKQDTVIVQMSGYGFDRRGIPLWLVRDIAARRDSIRNLGVFFHELYASGPPWRSSFWLSPVQRLICRKLVESCDFWMTNRDASADWLKRYGGDKPYAKLAVCSSMGERLSVSVERNRSVVVFGSAGVRAASYRAAGDEFFDWAHRESLVIHDIGPEFTDIEILTHLNANGFWLRLNMVYCPIRSNMSRKAVSLLRIAHTACVLSCFHPCMRKAMVWLSLNITCPASQSKRSPRRRLTQWARRLGRGTSPIR